MEALCRRDIHVWDSISDDEGERKGAGKGANNAMDHSTHFFPALSFLGGIGSFIGSSTFLTPLSASVVEMGALVSLSFSWTAG